MGVIVIDININIDLGNIWEMLSAIGTVGAVLLSLFLAFNASKPKISVQLSLDVPFVRWYRLVITKKPLDTFTIISFGYYQGMKKIPYENDLIEDVTLLNSDNREIGKRFPLEFTKESIYKIVLYEKYTNSIKGRSVRFYVEDIEGKVYKTQRMSMKKLRSLTKSIY